MFLDYQLGAQTGVDLLTEIRAAGDLRPVVILTGHGDESIAAEVMRSGADDYVAKNQMDSAVLRRAIDNAMARFARRKFEVQNRQLLAELRSAKDSLERKNQRLAELYQTAHQFVDNVSHEFRTPLTVIKEFTSIIRDGLAGEVNDEQREYLDIVSNRVDDLTTMVNDMLDISKLEAGMLGLSRDDCRIEEIFERVRTTLERKAASGNVALDIVIPEDLPTVHCDPEKIGRVLINLVVNAVKFSNEGGHVRVHAVAESAEHQIKVTIVDDGPGIAPANLEQIFQRFKQVGAGARASTRGFGLGLNIANELVRLNFGEITVESELGRGSRFAFTVPTADRGPLISRFLRVVEVLRNGSSYVSMITVRAAACDAITLEDVGALLRHQLRRSDLIFRVHPDFWLIVAATNQQELSAMLDRLTQAREETNQNRPGDPLPEIGLHTCGTWRVADHADEFVKRFLELSGWNASSPPSEWSPRWRETVCRAPRSEAGLAANGRRERLCRGGQKTNSRCRR